MIGVCWGTHLVSLAQLDCLSVCIRPLACFKSKISVLVCIAWLRCIGLATGAALSRSTLLDYLVMLAVKQISICNG